MSESTVRHSNPYWIDEKHNFITAFQTHHHIIHPELATNNDEYDIVIIGTGISGVGCAYWLRKLYPVERFPRILLLERNVRPCTGASGRSGNFLWLGYDWLASFAEEFGSDNACQWIEFQHENIQTIADIVKENQIDCEIDLTHGNIALACDQQEWERLIKCYEIIKDYIKKNSKTKLNLDNLELWDHEKCQQMLHSDKFHGGLFIHKSGTIWISKFVYGLLNYCLNQSGIDLITQGKVIRIENSKNIFLENGQVIIARQAIVHATNAYAVEYLDFVRGKIIPTRGQCSCSKPMKTIFWPFGISVHNGREYYHQSLIDGRIMFGGCRWKSPDTENNNQNDSEINELIKEEHNRYFSQWHPNILSQDHRIEFEYEWTGIMAFTIDNLPLIGPLPDDNKQFLLCGYNGDGMSNALLCAKAIARMIANENPYKEGEENNTISFLKMFLPERFTKTTTQST